MSNNQMSNHWADIYAQKVIREKGEKEQYVCASGITPSGTVHIGNFREIISVDLVVRALRDAGKKVRFIYSWDDYDVFRKVPKNMKDKELLETYLRKPITLVPDTSDRGAENYARANEIDVEEILPSVGIECEYIYQANRYQKGTYAQQMRLALEKKDIIREYLNERRTTDLEEDWFPILVFSEDTDKDTTTVLDWDKKWEITYRNDETDKVFKVDLRKAKGAKLPWRIDWPMRWAYEGVDFEPAGKDHHSEGGSFDTSRKIVELFGSSAPVSFQYDFISIKGRGGKISSSSGDVVSLKDVLEVYTPEVVRYLFASTRPNTEFSISFDLDVLKIYEDYDKCEKIYFGVTSVNDKKYAKEKRIYELSQVNKVPTEISYQIPFRHLCNMLQAASGDINAVISSLDNVSEAQKERLVQRCICAYNWIRFYSPEDFRYTIQTQAVELDKEFMVCLDRVKNEVNKMDEYTEKELSQVLYDIAHDFNIEPVLLFENMYLILIGKRKGPKLAGFMKTLTKKKINKILKFY